MRVNIGDTFGRLTVVREGERRRKYARFWFCLCECGKEALVSQSHLTSGHTGSCGCLFLECRAVPDAGFRGLLQGYKIHAKERGLEWALTDEQFKEITSSNCHYTGRGPSQVFTSSNSHYRRRRHGLSPNSGGVYIYN